MSASKKALKDTAFSLRIQIAKAEAILSALRLKLAQAEAKITGEPVPVSGLEMLWAAALPTARTRSSKQQCRIQWSRIPKDQRPLIDDLVSALKKWNRCEEWKKDGNAFAPGLHRYIERRMWEDTPEIEPTPSRYRATPSNRKPDPTDAITDPAEIAKFLSLKPLRINS
jgi:hypothetical protein